jgi:Cu(I)/Ag(I) efflux system membrane fusion protein
MRPEQHFDAPGKSPYMDMPLVPKFAAEVDVTKPEPRP